MVSPRSQRGDGVKSDTIEKTGAQIFGHIEGRHVETVLYERVAGR